MPRAPLASRQARRASPSILGGLRASCRGPAQRRQTPEVLKLRKTATGTPKHFGAGSWIGGRTINVDHSRNPMTTCTRTMRGLPPNPRSFSGRPCSGLITRVCKNWSGSQLPLSQEPFPSSQPPRLPIGRSSKPFRSTRWFPSVNPRNRSKKRAGGQMERSPRSKSNPLTLLDLFDSDFLMDSLTFDLFKTEDLFA